MKKLLFTLLLIPAAVLAEDAANNAQEKPTFKAGTTVRFVRVLPHTWRNTGQERDILESDVSSGQLGISGLSARIEGEGNKSYPVKHILFEQEPDLPMDFFVLMDQGNVIEQPRATGLGRAKDGLRAMLSALRPDDRVMIASYAAEFQMQQELTGDRNLLERAVDKIHHINAYEQTGHAFEKLLDYVEKVRALPEAKNRAATILMYAEADDHDSGRPGSSSHIYALTERLSTLGIPVVSVCPEWRNRGGPVGNGRGYDLAHDSGGVMIYGNDLMPPGGERLDGTVRRNILRDAANLSRKRYVIGYETQARAGEIEELQLVLPMQQKDGYYISEGGDNYASWRFKAFDPTEDTSARILGYKFLK
jgi:hypothetical protein